jgi:hypothetical protein
MTWRISEYAFIFSRKLCGFPLLGHPSQLALSQDDALPQLAFSGMFYIPPKIDFTAGS